MKKQRDNFGAAEFKIVCEPHKVFLIIHKNHIVAETEKDIYNKIFDYAIKIMGGRIDRLN